MADVDYLLNVSQRADRDIADIVTYIAVQSLQNASGVFQNLEEAMRDLEFLPGRHRIVGQSRKRRVPIHAMTVAPFIVYYCVDHPRRRVDILTILHGARLQPSRFD